MKNILWPSVVTGIALVLAIPVLVVVSNIFVPSGDVWQHLYSTVLSEYIANSILLMLGTAIGSLLLGVTTAWLVAMTEFPGRKFYEWALLLPMSFPAYIIAYTYTGMLDFAGPLQTNLREFTAWEYGDYWFPEVRSLEGAAIMMSLVLYPYVYLLTRAAFSTQSLCVLEVSRSLGNSPWKTFFKVALPMARPAIIAGLSLVLMETLADYGTVQYFSVSTFTTGIFRTWYGLDNAPAAAQLASVLLLFVVVLVTLERFSRRKARYYNGSRNQKTSGRFQLQRWNKWLATLICFSILLFAFLLPSGQLLIWAFETAANVIDERFRLLVVHSLLLAASASVLALILALVLGYGCRLNSTPLVKSAVQMAALGYAVPGTVIAVGVLITFGYIDNIFDSWMLLNFNVSTGLLFSGTLAALLFAYMVRFLAVSLHTVESGLARITPFMDEAARSLGCRSSSVLGRVHLPILRGSLLTALLLVFVDVLKELPATLILRPFNFNTLAVKSFELAADERLADSSCPSLAIVLAGMLPVLILNRAISRSRHEKSA